MAEVRRELQVVQADVHMPASRESAILAIGNLEVQADNNRINEKQQVHEATGVIRPLGNLFTEGMC